MGPFISRPLPEKKRTEARSDPFDRENTNLKWGWSAKRKGKLPDSKRDQKGRKKKSPGTTSLKSRTRVEKEKTERENFDGPGKHLSQAPKFLKNETGRRRTPTPPEFGGNL